MRQEAIELIVALKGHTLPKGAEKAYNRLCKAIEQAEKPVAYTTGHCKEKAQPNGCQLHNLHCGYPACDRKAVATPQPHREWVGLTDEEIEQEFGFIDELLRDCVQRTEAKLRSKNQ